MTDAYGLAYVDCHMRTATYGITDNVYCGSCHIKYSVNTLHNRSTIHVDGYTKRNDE